MPALSAGGLWRLGRLDRDAGEAAVHIALDASWSLLTVIGVVLLGRQLYQSVWLAIAFGALITLRHHIPRTSVNSLEPYFQARVLAFGIGIAAVAMFLRQRQMAAVALVALAGFCHATTGLWFAILIGTALMILDRRWRMPGAVVIAVAVISLVWRMATGPSMDPIWIEALGGVCRLHRASSRAPMPPPSALSSAHAFCSARSQSGIG